MEKKNEQTVGEKRAHEQQQKNNNGDPKRPRERSVDIGESLCPQSKASWSLTLSMMQQRTMTAKDNATEVAREAHEGLHT